METREEIDTFNKLKRIPYKELVEKFEEFDPDKELLNLGITPEIWESLDDLAFNVGQALTITNFLKKHHWTPEDIVKEASNNFITDLIASYNVAIEQFGNLSIFNDKIMFDTETGKMKLRV